MHLNADGLGYENNVAIPAREGDVSVLRSLKEISLKWGETNQMDFNYVDTHILFPMQKHLSRCPGSAAPSSYGSCTNMFSGNIGNVTNEVPEIMDIPPSLDKVSMLNSSQIISS